MTSSSSRGEHDRRHGEREREEDDAEGAAGAARSRRPTIELPPSDLRFARSEYVRYQQAVARVALRHGELGAARAALRVLNGPDFADAAAAAVHIRVLRSIRHHDLGVELAIEALLVLEPCPDRAG